MGFTSPTGDLLCGPCYFALWGPKERRMSSETERHRPESRRPKRGRPIWIPGPTGELDPRARSRSARRHRGP